MARPAAGSGEPEAVAWRRAADLSEERMEP